MTHLLTCYSNQSECKLPKIDLSLLENILPPQIERKDIIHVDFPAGKFSKTPQVVLMLTMIDDDQSDNTRLNIFPDSITVNGFDVHVVTWAGSKVYGIGANWLAYEE